MPANAITLRRQRDLFFCLTYDTCQSALLAASLPAVEGVTAYAGLLGGWVGCDLFPGWSAWSGWVGLGWPKGLSADMNFLWWREYYLAGLRQRGKGNSHECDGFEIQSRY